MQINNVHETHFIRLFVERSIRSNALELEFCVGVRYSLCLIIQVIAQFAMIDNNSFFVFFLLIFGRTVSQTDEIRNKRHKKENKS